MNAIDEGQLKRLSFSLEKEKLPKEFFMKRRLRLLSSNGSLAVCSVIQLTGYDHGVQHVTGGLGAFAETGADDFNRNLGDLGGSGGGARKIYLFRRKCRKKYS